MARDANPKVERDRQERILDAVLHLLATHGIAGVSIRAVARQADVALGLVNYHYGDKHALVCAALRRIEERDIALVEPDKELPARERLLAALRGIALPEYLNHEYLMLRMQVWSLSQIHEDFAKINTEGHNRYRNGLASLIKAASENMPTSEARRRADDIDLVQNGLWLTAFLGLEKATINRAIKQTEAIAFEA